MRCPAGATHFLMCRRPVPDARCCSCLCHAPRSMRDHTLPRVRNLHTHVSLATPGHTALRHRRLAPVKWLLQAPHTTYLWLCTSTGTRLMPPHALGRDPLLPPARTPQVGGHGPAEEHWRPGGAVRVRVGRGPLHAAAAPGPRPQRAGRHRAVLQRGHRGRQGRGAAAHGGCGRGGCGRG